MSCAASTVVAPQQWQEAICHDVFAAMMCVSERKAVDRASELDDPLCLENVLNFISNK